MERHRIIYLKTPAGYTSRTFRTREKAVEAFTRVEEVVTAGELRDMIEGYIVDSPEVPDCWVFILKWEVTVSSHTIDVIMEGIRSDCCLETDAAKELPLMITNYLQSLKDQATQKNIQKISTRKTKTNSR
ncbi:MAG: hypothetical protein Q8Q94_04645 [bacterium]|nr:hypothetical protein [bacterium]MDZ4299936.1 hypothetical protein [Candidatus Sungbacteria bacterium]